jgi:hypothetical protein
MELAPLAVPELLSHFLQSHHARWTGFVNLRFRSRKRMNPHSLKIFEIRLKVTNHIISIFIHQALSSIHITRRNPCLPVGRAGSRKVI